MHRACLRWVQGFCGTHLASETSFPSRTADMQMPSICAGALEHACPSMCPKQSAMADFLIPLMKAAACRHLDTAERSLALCMTVYTTLQRMHTMSQSEMALRICS